MKTKEEKFATEAEMVAKFCADLAGRERWRNPDPWTVYHETAGFDLLLVQNGTGIQVGVEAKLAFNNKVLCQALPKWSDFEEGPDYRAVMVPRYATQGDLPEIARRLGLGVITVSHWDDGIADLPDERRHSWFHSWHPWFPTKRCRLPDYVPDVVGGHPSPLQLTDWKIRAIKLLILLRRRGHISRADFKHLGLSPTRWTAPDGYLARGDGVYVAGPYTPDLEAQHPKAWSEIEADFEKWAPATLPTLTVAA